jgi:hypothetical protein
VTLVVSLHYPAAAVSEAREEVAHFIRELERDFSDEDGSLTVREGEP